MNENLNHDDANLDRNLRAIGQSLRLPGEPTHRQRERWKQPLLPVPASSLQRGVRFMKQHRFLTVAGAGSVAACLALTAILFVPTPGSTVEAATIFASFREAVGNAFQIEFEKVGAEGITADGRVVVMFDQKDGAANPFQSVPNGVYVEARAVADETADEDAAGLDVEVAVAMIPDREWAFVKLKSLPGKVVEDEPVAAIVQQMTQNGLLLDLDGIMEREGLDDIFDDFPLSGHFDADNDDRDVRVEKSVTINVGNGDGRTGHGHKHDVHVQGHAGGHDDHEDIEALTGFTEDELQRIALGVLTGQATADEFAALVSLLEHAATDVSVAETEAGLFVLTARGFNFEDDEEAQQLLGNMVVQVAYREGSGVAWATLEHIGATDGTVRFSLIDIADDDNLFDRERYMQNGAVMRFNVSQLAGFIEGIDNSH